MLQTWLGYQSRFSPLASLVELKSPAEQPPLELEPGLALGPEQQRQPPLEPELALALGPEQQRQPPRFELGLGVEE